MRKIWLMILTVVLGLSLTACQSGKVEETADTGVLTTYLEDLKAGNFEASLTKLETVSDNFKYGDNEVMKAFFAKMTYEIKETKVKDGAVAAQVLIKLPNTAIIYDDMMNNIGEEVQKLQAGDENSKTKASGMMIEYLMNKIQDEKAVMVENTIEVTIKQIDGKTVIVPTEELSKALSGIPVVNK